MSGGNSEQDLSIGQLGEKLAARHLESKGYMVLERNYRFERAELDLVCFHPAEDYRDGGEIVFVEVKTRKTPLFGRPENAVTGQKRRHITRAAEAYLYERKLTGALCRFDVVAVRIRNNEEPEFEHFENAFIAG